MVIPFSLQVSREANGPASFAKCLSRHKKSAALKSKTKPKNPYARSSKVSSYKTLQLVECFARDLSVAAAARATRMTERTVRDRYADIRGKLLDWCIKRPDVFNGFGHLLLDADDTINLTLLEAMFRYSQSAAFRARMKERYPKFNAVRDPVMNHVIELALRRFTEMDLPEINADFSGAVARAFSAAKVESFLGAFRRRLPPLKAQQLYWREVSRRLRSETGGSFRQFSGAKGEAFFRDLRIILRLDPL